MLTFLLLASPAAAAPVSTDRAWMLLDRGCPTDALVDIAAGLEAAPDHPGLHRVRVSATWDRSWDDGRALSWIYEAWHQAEPDNLGYRVGLAAALQRDDRKGSCERVSTLLDGQSTSDPAARYEVLRVLLGAADACPDIDAEPLRAELRAIGQGGHGAADTLALYWDLRGDARAAPAPAIDRLAAHPYRADAIARTLWSDDAKGVKAHRKAFVALVEPWLASDDPVRSLYAARALGHAGQDVASHL